MNVLLKEAGVRKPNRYVSAVSSTSYTALADAPLSNRRFLLAPSITRYPHSLPLVWFPVASHCVPELSDPIRRDVQLNIPTQQHLLHLLHLNRRIAILLEHRNQMLCNLKRIPVFNLIARDEVYQLAVLVERHRRG